MRSLLGVVSAILLAACSGQDTMDAGTGLDAGHTASWRPVPSMGIPRAAPAMVALADGTVLVTGGAQGFYAGAAPTASTESFDATTESWTTGPSLLEGRYKHTAIMLRSGVVMVIGGLTEGDVCLARTEFLDTGIRAWGRTGAMLQARAYQTATVLDSGKVLVVGGWPDNSTAPPLASAELYDPATGLWTATGSLATARGLHSAALLPSGQVLVVGGCTDNSCSWTIDTTELYDPASGTWAPSAPLPVRLMAPSSTTLLSGKVLVAGGCFSEDVCGNEIHQAWLRDPDTGAWTEAGSMSSGHALGRALRLPSGKVLVVGGDWSAGHAEPAEVYDPLTNTWTATGRLFAWHGNWVELAPLPGGRALLVGGVIPGGYTVRESELFEP